MKREQLEELLIQALETELGGIEVYTTALECAQNKDLREEWDEYLDQTKRHEAILRSTIEALGVDPEKQTPGRAVVRHIGAALVKAMELAKSTAPPEATQIVACECVVLAETKDHANWELLAECAEAAKGAEREALKNAVEEVEDEEDEHLYHTKGWCRELFITALGMPSVLPPPEEEKDVKTAIGAARAQQSRRELL